MFSGGKKSTGNVTGVKRKHSDTTDCETSFEICEIDEGVSQRKQLK